MRPARQLDELDVLDHLSLPSRGGIWWQNAIGVAVQDEGRHLVLRDVFPEIFDPRIDARNVPMADAPAATFQLSSSTRSLTSFPPVTSVIEVAQELHQQRRTVRANGGLDVLEHLALDAFRVVGRFHQVRPERADESHACCRTSQDIS